MLQDPQLTDKCELKVYNLTIKYIHEIFSPPPTPQHVRMSIPVLSPTPPTTISTLNPVKYSYFWREIYQDFSKYSFKPETSILRLEIIISAKKK